MGFCVLAVGIIGGPVVDLPVDLLWVSLLTCWGFKRCDDAQVEIGWGDTIIYFQNNFIILFLYEV